MKRSLALICIAWAGSATADWQVTHDGSTYVLCRTGDCLSKTVKVIDLPVTIPVTAKISEVPTNPPVLALSTTVSFRLGSARLTQSEKSRLKKFLEQYPEPKRYLVHGSTDRIGKKRFNQLLARKRAKSVAAYLHKSGVFYRDIKVKSRCCIEHPPNNNPAVRRAVVQVSD